MLGKSCEEGFQGRVFYPAFLLSILAMVLRPRSLSQQMHAAGPTFPAQLGRGFGGSRIKAW